VPGGALTVARAGSPPEAGRTAQPICLLAPDLHIAVETVRDVNHYTMLMGGGHGPRRVAATLAELAVGDAHARGFPD
jgi:hypothetical protein